MYNCNLEALTVLFGKLVQLTVENYLADETDDAAQEDYLNNFYKLTASLPAEALEDLLMVSIHQVVAMLEEKSVTNNTTLVKEATTLLDAKSVYFLEKQFENEIE